jgi:hypothetical protein
MVILEQAALCTAGVFQTGPVRSAVICMCSRCCTSCAPHAHANYIWQPLPHALPGSMQSRRSAAPSAKYDTHLPASAHPLRCLLHSTHQVLAASCGLCCCNRVDHLQHKHTAAGGACHVLAQDIEMIAHCTWQALTCFETTPTTKPERVAHADRHHY